MRVKNGQEFYSVVEIAQLIRESTSTIYYQLKSKNSDFPEPTLIDGKIHWNQEDVNKIRRVLFERDNTRGRKRVEEYTPLPNSSYSKLKVENLDLRAELNELAKELQFWKEMAENESNR